MTERPILFSAAMVRALLAGTKTQTRRALKAQPPEDTGDIRCGHYNPTIMRRGEEEPGEETFGAYSGDGTWSLRCPYGQPDDRLWVRHSASLFPIYFKPIAGWEGLYAAGTDGLIYRMDRGGPEALSGSPTSNGYLTVSLSRGKWETHAVHKLVCETFYGASPFDGAQVRHIDGDQTNNRPENLDWGTQEQNWQDRKSHGRGMGEEHHSAKLTPVMVEAIRASGLSQRKLAAEYGVSQATIWEAKNGATWGKHDPAPRNLPVFKMWRPSIHMPRWANRITLEITEVRVQRLQEISESDAYDEGIDTLSEAYLAAEHASIGGAPGPAPAVCAYASLWDSINGPGSWAANPWVWCIGFRRVEA